MFATRYIFFKFDTYKIRIRGPISKVKHFTRFQSNACIFGPLIYNLMLTLRDRSFIDVVVFFNTKIVCCFLYFQPLNILF